MGQIKIVPAWQESQSSNKKEVIEETPPPPKKNNRSFATLMDLCHLKNSELDKTFQKYKGCVVVMQ